VWTRVPHEASAERRLKEPEPVRLERIVRSTRVREWEATVATIAFPHQRWMEEHDA